jgi:hypothetical protein
MLNTYHITHPSPYFSPYHIHTTEFALSVHVYHNSSSWFIYFLDSKVHYIISQCSICIFHNNINDSLLNSQDCIFYVLCTRAICKVYGLTLLLWVGTLWQYGDSPFFKVLPLASNALLTMFHPLLENVLQTIDHFKISCLRAPFSQLEKPRNHMGQDLDCMVDVLMGFHWSTFSKLNTEFNSDLTPCNFRAFPTMRRELQGKKFRNDQWSAACFWEVGGAL